MKKLVFAISIAFIAFIAVAYKFSSNPESNRKHKKIPLQRMRSSIDEERISLNGVSFADANKWIMNFSDDPGGYNSKTTFWFSEAYIDGIDTLLKHEGADGIRIYLARRLNEYTTTLVVVSTIDDGPDPLGEGKNPRVHLDYFKHSSQFLHTKDVSILDENGDDGGGARLYTTPNCPPESCNVSAINYIECDKAAKWVQNTSGNDIDTRSEWFSFNLIENINKELHAAGNKADGIRIYLAESTYPDDDSHRFIITTTGPFKVKYHNDYYECNYKPQNFAFVVTDNGEICPNHCDGTTLPTNP